VEDESNASQRFDAEKSDARRSRPTPASSEPRAATPSVTAVVVAADPGDWFEETLDSIVTQDYPRLDLVVVDVAGSPLLAERVREVAPAATLLDASDTDGFSAAANAVLDTGLESAFLLMCHDDVALASDAVRVLVTEAMRSNAGITGPKLVDWEHPERLQHVGFDVDQFAAAADKVEPGELDQEQHDAVADVFAVPSAAVLIRRALFDAIGGFDPVMTRWGEDVDICWRAQLAGARVIVAPDALVRHRGDLIARTGVDDVRRTRARHQVRTVLVTGSRVRLLLTLPLMMLLFASEAAVALATGRLRQVVDVGSAWIWNLSRLGEIRRRRAGLRPKISVRHSDLRSLQLAGSARINAFVRGQIGRGGRSFGRELVSAIRTGTARFAVLSWALVVAFVLFGSRSLIATRVPAVGDFAAFPESSRDLAATLWSGWRDHDLGSAGSTPSGFGLLGLLATLLGGAVGLVRTAWVIGPIFVGLAGAWRLLAVTGSRRAQIGSLVAYMAIPLPWVSIAAGSWGGIGAYTISPWILRGLLELQASAPFRTTAGPVRTSGRAVLSAGSALGLGLIFDQRLVVILGLLGVGLLAGSLVAINPTGIVRIVAGTVVAAFVAAVVALPMAIDQLVASPTWDVIAGGSSGDVSSESLGQILRFAVGPHQPSGFLWAFAVPMVMPLLVGRAWRFDLAVRLWFVALVSWGLTLASVSGWLDFGLPTPSVLLGPAAAAIAALCGVAVAASEHDLRRAGFGWRQALLPVALVASVVAVLPALGSATSGRWDLGRGDYASVVPFHDPEMGGSYRVLWIGHPDNLPAEGSSFGGQTAWVATLDGLPTIDEVSKPPDPGASPLIGDVLTAVAHRDTSRAGRLFAGLGIRYVVALNRLAPAPFSSVESSRPVDANLIESLDTQLDLRRLAGVNSSMEVYENTEWASVRAAAVSGFDDGVDDIFGLQITPLRGTAGVLAGTGDNLVGVIPDGTEILLAQTPDAGWDLSVDGVASARRQSLGWAQSFVPANGGFATLHYATPRWRQLVVLLQMLILLGLGSLTLRRTLQGRG